MRKSIITAAVVVSAGIASYTATADGATVSLGGVPSPSMQEAQSSVEPVAYRKIVKRHAGQPGARHRFRHGPYVHFYRGWYARPWWRHHLGPTAAFGVGPVYGGYYGYGGGNAHVRWCLNRYRSYDPRTNTFIGFDGQPHRCVGPY